MLSFQPETVYYRRKLPHLYRHNQPVFISWRLKFDLPRNVLIQMKEMKEKFEFERKHLSEKSESLQLYTFQKKIFDWFDLQLGQAKEMPAVLDKTEIAGIIRSQIQDSQNDHYYLHAYCIMPNHVHVLITPFSDKSSNTTTLSTITKQWKGTSSRLINKLLNRSGALWAPESYDHMVRNELEFSKIVQYILLNPVKASLTSVWKDWKYSWVDAKLLDIMG